MRNVSGFPTSQALADRLRSRELSVSLFSGRSHHVLLTQIVLGLLTPLFLSGCKPATKSSNNGPSLRETQAWMHSFVAGRGTGATYEGSECSGTVTWLEGGNPNYTFSFSFSDLDPNTAKSHQTVVSPPALQNMRRATVLATNNLQKVQVYDYHKKQSSQDTVIEGIPFYSSEDAERFADALRRAIELCGGKPSAF